MGEPSLRDEFAAWLETHAKYLDPRISRGDAYLCWVGGYAEAIRWCRERERHNERKG